MNPTSNVSVTGLPRQGTQTGLPTQLTPLVGREREIALLGQLLGRADVRLVTLTGPGGVGKTSLAVQVAARQAGGFVDGVCFVSLAPVRDPDLLAPAIAQVLGLPDSGGATPIALLKDHLARRQLLLLLDNFEQLVAGAPLVTDLLMAAPRLKILVSSRAPLRVRSEYEFPVLPLALPAAVPGQNGAAPAAGDRSPAVALFIQRAQAIRPAFAPSESDLEAIAAICTRLDGLPLAIELAAARIKLLPPGALLARLGGPLTGADGGPGRSLQLLAGGLRDLPARQQTMRDTIEWSYSLLTATERRLFRCLSVFVGGCTLAAVETVYSSLGLENWDVLDVLAALIDNSLVQQVEPPLSPGVADAEPRFAMLETIREYGLETLEAAGETTAARAAHAAYYLALSEDAAAALAGGDTRTYVDRLAGAHDNLRAALGWANAAAAAETLGRLCAALWRFWRMRGYQTEGRRWLAAALAALPARQTADSAPAEETRLRARILNGAAVLAYYQNEYILARAWGAECLDLYTRLGDKRGLVEALKFMALCARIASDLPTARALYARCRTLYEELGDQLGIGEILFLEAAELYLFHQYAEALVLTRQSLEIQKAHNYKLGMAQALTMTGNCLFYLGHPAEARALIADESLPLLHTLGDRGAIARSLYTLARIALETGEYATAAAHCDQALVIHREMGDRVHMGNILEVLINLALAQGQPWRAARLLGYTEVLVASVDFARFQVSIQEYKQAWPTLFAPLSEAEFAGACAEGAAMTLDDALAAYHAAEDEGPVEPKVVPPLAVGYMPGLSRRDSLGTHYAAADEEPGATGAVPPLAGVPAPPGSSGRAGLDELTDRERAVLRLIAQGLTNKQIADQLVISPNTVGTHLRAIFDKLGVTTRAAATRYAVDRRLI
jgi:predicted ATPase/DNA-binding CsgD family transcriptional regulator